MRRTKALFIAGSHNQANYWARYLSFAPREWRYVSGPQDMQGLRPDRLAVYVVGTYWENRHAMDALRYLAAIGFEPIFAEEMVPRG